LRFRTKEETDAAHDLLELSRSLPPLPPGPTAVAPAPAHQQTLTHLGAQQPQLQLLGVGGQPPTPPSPEQTTTPNQQQPQPPFPAPFATLVYITPSSPSSDAASVQHHLQQLRPEPQPYSLPGYPLTPPTEASSDSSSTTDISSPSPSLSGGETSPYNESPSTPSLSIADGRAKKQKDGIRDKSKYICSECGKHYATSSNLSRHKQTHRSLDSTNAKKCPICGKMYVSMPALSMHVLTHNLNHKCNVCGKAFSRPWLLQGHLRSHTGHKPYNCTVCNKSFADRSNLRAHMQTHSPSKNFQCSRCHKTFALKSYLNKHYESSCVRSTTSSSSARQK